MTLGFIAKSSMLTGLKQRLKYPVALRVKAAEPGSLLFLWPTEELFWVQFQGRKRIGMGKGMLNNHQVQGLSLKQEYRQL